MASFLEACFLTSMPLSSASFLLQIREQLLKLSAKENHIFT